MKGHTRTEMNTAKWAAINKRRFHLISKKHSRAGLSSAENAELEELQLLADKHADSVRALPIHEDVSEFAGPRTTMRRKREER